MKKLMLLLFAVLLGATSVMGQISFSGVWYRKGSGKEYSKVWHTPDYSRQESVNNGDTTVMIFDKIEMKAYIINETKKTIMVMNDIDQFSLNQIVGYDLEVSRSSQREFKGMEEIEGKECAHYWVTSESLLKTGATDGASYNEWIWEPLKSSNYNGAIAHDNTGSHMDGTVVLRNIKIGAQPAYLFKVPEDGYEVKVVPAGGLLELITGKSRSENVENIDNKADKMKEIFNSVNKKVNDPNASDTEKMKNLLEMLGGSKKKK